MEHPLVVVMLCSLVAWFSPLVVEAQDTDDVTFQAKDCHDHKANGERKDRVYIIYTNGLKRTVYCEGMSENSPEDTAWTVIQRRRDKSWAFDETWRNYKRGFGPPETDHWAGNEVIYDLTNAGPRYILRIELETFETPLVGKHADYSEFRIGPESENYKLYYANYSGDAGDSLRFHRGMSFSTIDRDNDEWPGASCALMLRSGWWFNDCGSSNLNGQFYRGKYNPEKDAPYFGGIWWFGMGDMYTSFRSVMKVRPVLEDYIPPGIIA